RPTAFAAPADCHRTRASSSWRTSVSTLPTTPTSKSRTSCARSCRSRLHRSCWANRRLYNRRPVEVERGSDLRNDSSKPAATVGRVTAVLDAFLEADGNLGVTELAAQLGLAKSVVHRLMTALTDAEYLSHDVTTRRYALGPKALRLGVVAAGQVRIHERA